MHTCSSKFYDPAIYETSSESLKNAVGIQNRKIFVPFYNSIQKKLNPTYFPKHKKLKDYCNYIEIFVFEFLNKNSSVLGHSIDQAKKNIRLHLIHYSPNSKIKKIFMKNFGSEFQLTNDFEQEMETASVFTENLQEDEIITSPKSIASDATDVSFEDADEEFSLNEICHVVDFPLRSLSPLLTHDECLESMQMWGADSHHFS